MAAQYNDDGTPSSQNYKDQMNQMLAFGYGETGIPISAIGKSFAKGGPVTPVGFKHANPTHKRFGLTGDGSLLKKGGIR